MPGRLAGERVLLRELRAADIEPYVRAFLEDPPLLEAIGIDDAPSAREVRTMLKHLPKLREAGERLQLVMADPASEEFLGEIVLHHFGWSHRRAEVGFFVVRAARRRGVALEAVNLLVEWAFSELAINRMQLATLPGNAATIALAERAGFQREGVLRGYTFERGEFKDNVIFSRLA